jgi:hypothetical protein
VFLRLRVHGPGIDDDPLADLESYNILDWPSRVVVSVVTNRTARDTDEVITGQVPLCLGKSGRGIRPRRNELESVNRLGVCRGILVVPGDVVFPG